MSIVVQGESQSWERNSCLQSSLCLSPSLSLEKFAISKSLVLGYSGYLLFFFLSPPFLILLLARCHLFLGNWSLSTAGPCESKYGLTNFLVWTHERRLANQYIYSTLLSSDRLGNGHVIQANQIRVNPWTFTGPMEKEHSSMVAKQVECAPEYTRLRSTEPRGQWMKLTGRQRDKSLMIIMYPGPSHVWPGVCSYTDVIPQISKAVSMLAHQEELEHLLITWSSDFHLLLFLGEQLLLEAYWRKGDWQGQILVFLGPWS